VLMSVGRRPNSEIPARPDEIKVNRRVHRNQRAAPDRRSHDLRHRRRRRRTDAGPQSNARGSHCRGSHRGHKVASNRTRFPPSSSPILRSRGPAHRNAGQGTRTRDHHRQISLGRFGARNHARSARRSHKLLIDPKTERVLGVGIVGVGAGELIAEGVLAIECARWPPILA